VAQVTAVIGRSSDAEFIMATAASQFSLGQAAVEQAVLRLISEGFRIPDGYNGFSLRHALI
jgi:hypothetical protein